VRIAEIGPRAVKADMELVWHDSVVVGITGWVDRRFDSDAPLFLMVRQPGRHSLVTPISMGCVAVEERWSDSASRELLTRRYLDSAERAEYRRRNPHEQRLWLLGRVAAKDAVRHELWERGHGQLFPVEVPLADDDEYSVVVTAGPAQGMRVALAVAPWLAVATVGEGEVAVEPLADGDGPAEPGNRRGGDRGQGEWETRIVRSPVHRPVAKADTDGDTTGGVAQGVSETRKEYRVARTRQP